MNIFQKIFKKENEESKILTDEVQKQEPEKTSEIPWDYIRKVSSDNSAFFNDHKDILPAIYKRIKDMGRDPVIMLVAFEQEKWRALLALLYKRPDNLFLTPETFTKETPRFSNNGYCNVYITPVVNGSMMQSGVYALERDWLFSEFCWMQGIPPMFINLIKAENTPHGSFTVVVLAKAGMNVRHLPIP